MRRLIYHTLRQVLPQEKRTKLKSDILALKHRFAPIIRRLHGTFTAADLIGELEQRLAGREWSILMVHSSYNDLLPMYEQGPFDLLRALQDLCGADRTLAMPGFSYGRVLAMDDPVFDARRTPSEMGLLTEIFRRHKGVKRSLHPTHSVLASGPAAERLTRDHHLVDTNCGEGTPFGIMAEEDAVIVGIGTEYFRSLTQVHTAEGLLGEEFPVPGVLGDASLPGRSVKILDTDGAEHVYTLKAGTEATPPRRMDVLQRLMSPQELMQWRFHGVSVYMVSARRVTECLVDAARKGVTIYQGYQ